MIVTHQEKNCIYLYRDELIDIDILHKQVEPYFDVSADFSQDSDVEQGRSKVTVFTYREKRYILKKYHHGGVLQKILQDKYLTASRFVREMVMLEMAARSGIKTVLPVAVVVKKFGFLFKAIIITEFIKKSKNLAEYIVFSEEDDAVLKVKIMKLISRHIAYFHNQGFYHPDLQIKNILLRGSETPEVFIIDFDKVSRVSVLPMAARVANVLRFIRSIIKFNRNYDMFDIKDENSFIDEYIQCSCLNREQFLAAYRKKKKIMQVKWSISDLLVFS